MPLLTMVPIKITKPSKLIIEICSPVTYRAIKPPVKAKGTVKMMINGDSRLWNCATMTR